MRQRCGDPANAVREFAEVASGELAIFQQIEQKSIHVRAHRFQGIQCQRIAVPLIGVEHAQRRIESLREQCEACFGL